METKKHSKDKQLKYIAQKVNEIVESIVLRTNNEDHKYKMLYDSIISDLELDIKLTEEHLSDLKDGSLKFSQIELEGFLRALKTMLDRFKTFESN